MGYLMGLDASLLHLINGLWTNPLLAGHWPRNAGAVPAGKIEDKQLEANESVPAPGSYGKTCILERS
jgi:hypothetical protein